MCGDDRVVDLHVCLLQAPGSYLVRIASNMVVLTATIAFPMRCKAPLASGVAAVGANRIRSVSNG